MLKERARVVVCKYGDDKAISQFYTKYITKLSFVLTIIKIKILLLLQTLIWVKIRKGALFILKEDFPFDEKLLVNGAHKVIPDRFLKTSWSFMAFAQRLKLKSYSGSTLPRAESVSPSQDRVKKKAESTFKYSLNKYVFTCWCKHSHRSWGQAWYMIVTVAAIAGLNFTLKQSVVSGFVFISFQIATEFETCCFSI